MREPPPGYRTQSEDTSYAVEQFLLERWRAMEPHEKARLLEEMSQAARDLVRAGIELHNPGLGSLEIEKLVLERMVGSEPMRRPRGTAEEPPAE